MLAQQIGELLRGGRLTEIETLHFIAGMFPQEVLLLPGFHPFSNDCKTQAFAHADNRLDDYFERIDGEVLYLGQRRIADAEIIDSQPDSQAFDCGQHSDHLRRILHYHTFGNFKFQQIRRHAGIGERFADVVDQVVVRKLTQGQINSHTDRRKTLAMPGNILGTNGFQHPPADGHDQPRFFGHKNES